MMAAVPAILDMIVSGLKKQIADKGGLLEALFNGAVDRRRGAPVGCWVELLTPK